MPAYKFQAPDGSKFTLNGDSPPNEQELEAAYAALPSLKPSPIAEQEAFKQQYIQENAPGSNLNQALSALVAPAKAGAGMVKGLYDTIVKGIQGVGTLAGSPNLVGNVNQTVAEVVPGMSFDIANAIRQAVQNPSATLGSLNKVVNPLGSAIQSFMNPRGPITPEEAQTAYENELVNRAFQQQAEQGIASFAQRQVGLPPTGEANIDVARAAPVVLVPGGGGAALRGVGALARGAEALGAAAISPVQTTQALGRGVLNRVAPKVAARTLPATVEQSSMAVLDLGKEEVARHIPIVNQRIGELFKSAPKTADEALKFANTTEASLAQDALAADIQAAEQGLAPRSDLVIQRVQDTVDNIPTLTPAERTTLVQDAIERYSDVATTEKGRAMQQRLNKEFEAQYANDTFDRAAPANEVKLSVRNSIAEQMDEINKGITGIDSSPYSDIGSLIEFKGNLQKTLGRIEGAEARRKTGIGVSAKKSKLPTTQLQLAGEVKRSLLSPLQKTQLEKLNQNVSKIFQEGPKAPTPLALSPDIQQSIIQKYSIQNRPASIPSVSKSEFSPDIQLALKKLGVKPGTSNYEAMGKALQEGSQTVPLYTK